MYGVRFENHTVAGGGRFPFPCTGKIEISVSRQAQGIAEQIYIYEEGATAGWRVKIVISSLLRTSATTRT